ncbi:MAG: hypothetical protein QXQ90_05335 [Desulfurococcaceae archaeon]
MSYKQLRADLSGPVLAIIVTVAIIAAGLGILAYFWYVAPSSAKTPTLVIVGEPAVLGNRLYITVKNIGSKEVQIQSVVIGGTTINVIQQVNPGEELALEIDITGATVSGPVAEGVLLTTAGTYPFNAYIVSQPPASPPPASPPSTPQ